MWRLGDTEDAEDWFGPVTSSEGTAITLASLGLEMPIGCKTVRERELEQHILRLERDMEKEVERRLDVRVDKEIEEGRLIAVHSVRNEVMAQEVARIRSSPKEMDRIRERARDAALHEAVHDVPYLERRALRNQMVREIKTRILRDEQEGVSVDIANAVREYKEFLVDPRRKHK